ncbi:MAG: asparagine synthase (glutamine-hydrolyzing) [Pelagibacterium sp. SCN 63-23]|nr:MAG: asparagine synthase (glutamine-hydrolyzing) [Pelagibacterium sp. SCN 63-23]
MCGIFGYFDRQGRGLSERTLAAMASAIRHRGPDEQGVFAEPGIALGNQRLSIIDVDGGSQPFVSDDSNIVVVQNGEIFNHVELAAELKGTRFACRTHSDTEVLLRLYEREGIDFVSRLNGMFAIAIFDRRTQSVYLIRDRIGVKPLYIFDDGSRAVFGSEIKAILPATGSRQMDEEALYHFLTFNYVPRPFTMFSGVRHVLPGHWLKIDRNGTQLHRWWDLASVDPIEQSEAAWIEEINATLEDAVRIRLRADVPFGAFLSGGVDSSTIVGLMSRHMASPVKTFSIGFDDPRYDETAFAQEAADMFGTEHSSQRVAPNMLDLWPMATYHCDQPHGDVSFLPTFKVSEMAAKHVKMVLTGDGGDELFAGYDKYKHFFTAAVDGLDEAAFRSAYYRNISLFQDEQKARLLGHAGMQRPNSFALVSELFDRVPHWDRINQALYIDMELLLSGNNLVKPDRMGMAVSLEARTPFLDYRMMELAFRMPGNMKLRDGVTKYVLKKAVSPMIGHNLAYREKQMFTVPVGGWFRSELREYCRQMLGEQSFGRRTGLFSNEGSVLLENHIQGSQNNTREIRALIAIEHWAEAFGA